MSSHLGGPPQQNRVELPSLLPNTLRATLRAVRSDATAPDCADRRGGGERTLRDWLVDLAAIALSLGCGAAYVAGDRTSSRPLPVAVDVAVGGLCCVALWWRRRRPVTLALAMVPFGALSAMAAGAVTVAGFTVAVHRRFEVAVTVGTLNLATIPMFYLPRGMTEFSVRLNMLLATLMTVTVTGCGMLVRSRRQLVAFLDERARDLEAQQVLREEQARQAERAAIAREMHDVMAHRMSLVSLHAGVLGLRAEEESPELASMAEIIRDNAHEALQELRQVMGVLRDNNMVGSIRAQPDLTSVPRLLDAARAVGMEVTYTSSVDLSAPLPTSSGRTAYRLVQEGLTNARKHAPRAPVEVSVNGGPGDGVTIRVANPLPPSPPPSRDRAIPGARLGFVGLRERVGLAGGYLRHGVNRQRGVFELEAWLPW